MDSEAATTTGEREMGLRPGEAPVRLRLAEAGVEDGPKVPDQRWEGVQGSVAVGGDLVPAVREGDVGPPAKAATGKRSALSETQVKAIALLVDVIDGEEFKSTGEIAAALGIGVQTLSEWKRSKYFATAVIEAARARTKSNAPRVYARMLALALADDRQMIKLFVERFGSTEEFGGDSDFALADETIEQLTITARRLKPGHHKEG